MNHYHKETSKIMEKLIIMLLTVLSFSAHAGLIGDEVRFEWVAPGGGGTLFGPATATVGAGTEFDTGDFVVDIDDDSILVSLSGNFPGSATLDYIFTDLDWMDASGGVISDTVLTVLGGPALNFSINHTLDSITVSNTAFLEPIGPGDYFRIDIMSAAQALPEPTTLAIFGVGLVCLCVMRRRAINAQRRKAFRRHRRITFC